MHNTTGKNLLPFAMRLTPDEKEAKSASFSSLFSLVLLLLQTVREWQFSLCMGREPRGHVFPFTRTHIHFFSLACDYSL